MDLENLTSILRSDDITHAEITTYHGTKLGTICKKTIFIDYYDDDYRWSTKTKVIQKRKEIE